MDGVWARLTQIAFDGDSAIDELANCIPPLSQIEWSTTASGDVFVSRMSSLTHSQPSQVSVALQWQPQVSVALQWQAASPLELADHVALQWQAASPLELAHHWI